MAGTHGPNSRVPLIQPTIQANHQYYERNATLTFDATNTDVIETSVELFFQDELKAIKWNNILDIV